MTTQGPEIEDLTHQFSNLGIVVADSYENQKAEMASPARIVAHVLPGFRIALKKSNPQFGNLSDSQLIALTYFIKLLRKLRSSNISLSTFPFVAYISFKIKEITTIPESESLFVLDAFISDIKVKKWLEEHRIDDYLQVTPSVLMPWLTSEKSVEALHNFCGSTNIQTYLFTLFRKILKESDALNEAALTELKAHENIEIFMRESFIPDVFLALDTDVLKSFNNYYKLIDLCFVFSVPISGQARRYINNLNQCMYLELSDLDSVSVFRVLKLNNEIFKDYSVDLLQRVNKEAIVNKLIIETLTNKEVEFLWELRWTLFKNISKEITSKLHNYFETRGVEVESSSFSWSSRLEGILRENATITPRRSLPYTQREQEYKVISRMREVRDAQIIPGEISCLRFGAQLTCARLLYEMSTHEATPDGILNLALVGQVLQAANNTTSDDEALIYALNVLKGAFKTWGWFERYSMHEYTFVTPDNILATSMLDQRVASRLGFLKSTDLRRFGLSVVLLKFLDLPLANSHLKELRFLRTNSATWANMPVTLYSNLADELLPHIFSGVQSYGSINTVDLSTLLMLMRLAIIYPSNLSEPQFVWFMKHATQFVLNELNCLESSVICCFLKLCEFYEIKYNKSFLSLQQKHNILDKLLSFSYEWEVNGNLIRFKSTLFNDIPNSNFDSVLEQLNNYCLQRAKRSEEAVNDNQHPHEIELSNAIREELPAPLRSFVQENHVCERTGRELDIVYIDGNLKLAIHIDGILFHYYKDRAEFDFETLSARQSLKNAGWKNISLPLYPGTQIDEPFKEFFAKGVVQFINNLNNDANTNICNDELALQHCFQISSQRSLIETSLAKPLTDLFSLSIAEQRAKRKTVPPKTPRAPSTPVPTTKAAKKASQALSSGNGSLAKSPKQVLPKLANSEPSRTKKQTKKNASTVVQVEKKMAAMTLGLTNKSQANKIVNVTIPSNPSKSARPKASAKQAPKVSAKQAPKAGTKQKSRKIRPKRR